MGGAILELNARTYEELKMQVDKTIREAEWKGLTDLRGIKYFTPLTYVKADGTLEKKWTAFLWVHS